MLIIESLVSEYKKRNAFKNCTRRKRKHSLTSEYILLSFRKCNLSRNWSSFYTWNYCILQHEVFVWSLLKRYTAETYQDIHSGPVTCVSMTADSKKIISGNERLLSSFLNDSVIFKIFSISIQFQSLFTVLVNSYFPNEEMYLPIESVLILIYINLADFHRYVVIYQFP